MVDVQIPLVAMSVCSATAFIAILSAQSVYLQVADQQPRRHPAKALTHLLPTTDQIKNKNNLLTLTRQQGAVIDWGSEKKGGVGGHGDILDEGEGR